MGRRHIISVSNDLIQLNGNRHDEVAMEIGAAIISLCGDQPEMGYVAGKLQRIEYRSVLNGSAAIVRAGELDYNDTRIFAWSRASLKQLDKLSLEELREVAALVQSEIVLRETAK